MFWSWLPIPDLFKFLTQFSKNNCDFDENHFFDSFHESSHPWTRIDCQNLFLKHQRGIFQNSLLWKTTKENNCKFSFFSFILCINRTYEDGDKEKKSSSDSQSQSFTLPSLIYSQLSQIDDKQIQEYEAMYQKLSIEIQKKKTHIKQLKQSNVSAFYMLLYDWIH